MTPSSCPRAVPWPICVGGKDISCQISTLNLPLPRSQVVARDISRARACIYCTCTCLSMHIKLSLRWQVGTLNDEHFVLKQALLGLLTVFCVKSTAQWILKTAFCNSFLHTYTHTHTQAHGAVLQMSAECNINPMIPHKSLQPFLQWEILHMPSDKMYALQKSLHRYSMATLSALRGLDLTLHDLTATFTPWPDAKKKNPSSLNIKGLQSAVLALSFYYCWSQIWIIIFFGKEKKRSKTNKM